MAYIYIAIGPYCWGKGSKQQQAVRALQEAWPTFLPRTGTFAVYRCPEGSRVTNEGAIAYPINQTAPELVRKYVQGERVQEAA